MGRSPIEMMVDRACGVEVVDGRIVQPARSVKALDAETQALLNVADAAKAWRELGIQGKRTDRDEQALAEAVDVWISLGG